VSRATLSEEAQPSDRSHRGAHRCRRQQIIRAPSYIDGFAAASCRGVVVVALVTDGGKASASVAAG